MRPQDVLYPRPDGLYAPGADAYIDPVTPVPRAIITHGHADHARWGHGSVLATPETLAIMASRFGADFAHTRQAARFGEAVRVGDATVTLYPAGHVLGSAQAAVEQGGVRVVASGDYKRRRDPTCVAFEPVQCDVFITEATFALPVFTHPPTEDEIAKLLRSVAMFPDSAHLVGAYALGKAQRVIMHLREAGWDKPIYTHGALDALNDLYRAHGVDLGVTLPAIGVPKAALKGAIALCPPSAIQTPWARRFPEPITAFASGWMRVRARARQRGVELPLVISDHADWNELTQTIRDVGAPEVWITHGEADALAHWCGLNGVRAKPLHLVGYGDESEPAPEAA